MAHTYIFLLDRGRVLTCRAVEDDFEVITRLGEDYSPVDDNFWSWWKEAAAFMDGEETDFCFIYDKRYAMLQNTPETKGSDPTSWTFERIRQFLKCRTRLGTVRLISSNNTEISFKLWEDDASERRLYTNIALVKPKFIPADEEPEEIEEPADETEAPAFSRYQRSKLAEDEKNKLI